MSTIGVGVSAAKDFLVNPILEKDLRSTARSLRFFLFILAFLFISSILVLIITAELHTVRSGTGREMFEAMFLIQALCVGISIPAYGCTTVAAERQRRTFDLLRITSLQPWQIVWGKFLAIMSYVVVFIVGFLPLVTVCFLYGGTDPQLIILEYLYLLLAAALCSAFCLMLSAASSNSVKTVIVGYIFIFFAGSMWFGMGTELWRWGRTARAVPAGLFLSTEVLLCYLAMLFLWSLFYIAATSLLKPPSWNKSTSLRIWLAAYTLASLGLFCHLTDRPGGFEELAAYLIAFVGAPGVFAAIGFCGEPAELQPRLKAKVRKTPRVLRLFAPGRRSAALLVRLVFALAAGGATTFFLYSDPRWPDKGLYLMCGILVYVNFCCSLAAAVRSLWDVARSRIITISILAGLILLPMLAFLDFNRYHPLSGIIWISPPLALADYLAQAYGCHESGPAIFFGFYIVAAGIAFLLGSIYRRRRRRPV